MTSHDASDAGKMPEGPYKVVSLPYDEWAVQDAHGADLCCAQNESLARLFASAPELKAEVERLREALEQVANVPVDGHGQAYYWRGRDIAHAALARKDGPA